MRIDKFLKVSRIIKRRTLAKEVCDRQQVMVNGRMAKAGTDVGIGDIVEISLGQRRVKVRIAEVRETIPANQAKELYELIEDFRLKE